MNSESASVVDPSGLPTSGRHGQRHGWPVVLDFGDVASEREALRRGGALVPLGVRTRLALTGDDRASFLHNLTTNEVRKLPPGDGCEALWLDARGHVKFHGLIFSGAHEHVIETVPGVGEALQTHLDRYLIRERVELADRSEERLSFYLGGADGDALLERINLPRPAERLGAQVSGEFSGSEVSAARVGMTRPAGLLVDVARQAAGGLWSALVDAGAKPTGFLAFEAARIEARWPWSGIDLGEKVLAQELGRDAELISFVKGCYLGQETVARLDALGHVNRLLRCIAWEAGEPTAGLELSRDGRPVGSVTSGVAIPGEPSVALAWVRVTGEDIGGTLESPLGPARVLA